jgi:Zeta toxin
MKFRDFISENKEVHHVMAFGRMSPPTTGHEVLVNKVKDVAKQVGGNHSVVLSHTQDKDKNPLSSADKVKHAKRFFPKTNISTSSKESPTFLSHAEQLHKQGVTHLHMVAGSDRVPEYKKKLAQYNGPGEGKLYNFKKITVHSAGERDPDAEGTAGMSASKMRAHAKEGNFKEFKKGVPSHVPEHHAKEMFHDVRKGMQIKESINEEFETLLFEGVHDKSIFKVVFLAGGPGSGKDYVLDNTLAGHGMTEMNSDKALEFLMDKNGLDKTMPASEEEKRNLVRGKAKNITELRQRLAILGRNGLIINGTGDDVEKISKIKKKLEDVGYESSMVLVNTADEVSKKRNIERGQRGGRTVPEPIRKEKWDNVQNGRVEFAKMFGDNYMEFDNSEDLRQAPPEVVKAKKEEMLQMFTKIKEFVSTPPKNPIADAWVAMELQKKDTLPIPKNGAEKTANPDSGAAEEARKMGLKYYGFGRYGQNGKVTHRVVHDKLVEVEKEPHKEPNVPTSGSSMKKPEPKTKKVNESFETFLSESVTVSITGDTVEEVQSMMSSMQTGYATEQTEEETYDGLSNHSESLTLGKTMDVVGEKQYSQMLSNADIDAIFEEKKVKLLRGKDGKPRIFLIRRSAAKESHLRGGEVMKHPKGYVIKIKEENEDVKVNQKFFEQIKNSRRSTSTFLTEGRISNLGAESGNQNYTPAALTIGIASTEQGTGEAKPHKEKITLSQIRAKQKEDRKNTQESIDQGIETGLSMATSGENLGRATGEKINLRKRGKASSMMDETIGAGGEDATSTSDNNELELKRKGINLKTFKANRSISS